LRARQLSAVVLTGALALVAAAQLRRLGRPPRVRHHRGASAENAFALNLLRPSAERQRRLLPYSVDAALTMAGAGAEGPTAAQIDRVLGAPSAAAADANAAALARAIAAATSSASGAPTVELANALWIERGIPLQTPFVTTLTDTFAPRRKTPTSAELRKLRGRQSTPGCRAHGEADRDLLPTARYGGHRLRARQRDLLKATGQLRSTPG